MNMTMLLLFKTLMASYFLIKLKFLSARTFVT